MNPTASNTVDPLRAGALLSAHGVAAAWSRHAYAVGIAIALLLGLVLRGYYILSSDFPLHDGGLFYVMVEDLLANGFRVPDVTSYNGDANPYTYSPLAFYLAAALKWLTPLSLADIFRIVPLIATTVTVVVFWRFAQTVLGATVMTVAATFAFALIPRTFLWNIMGGGLTRSLGFLFALLALHALYRFFTEHEHREIWPALGWSTLTVLTHIGTLPFLAFSSLLFVLLLDRSRRGVLVTAAVGVGAAVLTAPWWGSMLAVHGPEPFLAAQATGGSVFSSGEIRQRAIGKLARLGVAAWTGGTTAEPLYPLLGSLGLFGVLAALRPDRMLLPVWWLTILVLDDRQGLTFATVPMAMLAGLAITDIVIPLTARAGAWTTRMVLAFILLYATGSAFLNTPAYSSDLRLLSSLTKEERQAMQWVAASTPQDARFVVVPESDWTHWGASKNAEWFPALAKRTSIATVQGTEWARRPTFDRRLAAFKALMPCASSTVACVEDWSRSTGLTFTHVYIPQPVLPAKLAHLRCCQVLIDSLNADPNYERIYSGPGAVIFAQRRPIA